MLDWWFEPDRFLSRLGFFAVWGVDEQGRCTCPNGAARRGDKATCVGWRVGKHPFYLPREEMLCGEPFGFKRGYKDAVTWDEWDALYADHWILDHYGTRMAAALPGDLWVLDVDSPEAWKELVALVVTGALPRDRVLAYDVTRRGCHVWVQADHDGWTSGTAQSALKMLGCRHLQVKSNRGYVVWPSDGKHAGNEGRRFRLLVLLWFLIDLDARKFPTPPPGFGDGVVAAGLPPVPPPERDVVDNSEDALTVTWLNLRIWTDRLTWIPEGDRNNALNRVSFLNGRPAIRAGHPVEEVRQVLYRAARRAGLEHGEAERTIRSGLGLG